MNKELGKLLKEQRNKSRLTQQEAADKLNLKNKSTLASWEGGKAEPDITTFLQLCCYYGISEAYALANKIGLTDTALWDFSEFRNDNQRTMFEKSEYTFCPYCGKELPKDKTNE